VAVGALVAKTSADTQAATATRRMGAANGALPDSGD
jgi:hypothetical protein